jgi:hypothetical protein
MREIVIFTNPSRFSAISAFQKTRTGKKRNLLRLLGQPISGLGAVYLPDALYPNTPYDLYPCHAGYDDSTEKPT